MGPVIVVAAHERHDQHHAQENDWEAERGRASDYQSSLSRCTGHKRDDSGYD